MKQTYTKPTLRVERFTIAQSIATSCGWVNGTTYGKPNHADKVNCGWDDGFGSVYWLNETENCTTKVGIDFEHTEVCYNNPNGNVTIFAS